MRKFVMGLLVGVGIASALNVSAAVESLVGKSVDNEYIVKLEGKELEKKAVAVEGSSYAPVRVIAETLGLNVDFKDGEVLLNRKKTEVKDVMTLDRLDYFIQQKQDSIATRQNFIRREKVNLGRSPEITAEAQKYIDGHQAEIDKLTAEIADLERQKAELQP